MDILNKFEGFPHLLENIFSQTDYTTVLKIEKKWPKWKQIISKSSGIWQKLYERNKRDSPVWGTISSYMEHRHPELVHRTEQDGVTNYRETCKQVERYIQEVPKFSPKNFYCYSKSVSNSAWPNQYEIFRVNENNIYIANLQGEITVMNRWTGKITNRLEGRQPNFHMIDFKLNDRVLVTRWVEGDVVVHDLKTLKVVQVFNDNIESSTSDGAVALGSDILVNIGKIRTPSPIMVITTRRWDPSRNRFDFDIEDTTVLNCSYLFRNVYLSDQFLVVDMVENYQRLRRVIKIFSLKPLELLIKRKFSYDDRIKPECYNNVIIVSHKDKHAAWNFVKNTIKPLNNLPLFERYLCCSAAVSLFPDYQYNLSYDFGVFHMCVKAVKARQGSSSVSNPLNQPNSVQFPDINYMRNDVDFYFDGVQAIYNSEGGKIYIADYIG